MFCSQLLHERVEGLVHYLVPLALHANRGSDGKPEQASPTETSARGTRIIGWRLDFIQREPTQCLAQQHLLATDILAAAMSVRVFYDASLPAPSCAVLAILYPRANHAVRGGERHKAKHFLIHLKPQQYFRDVAAWDLIGTILQCGKRVSSNYYYGGP